MDKVILITGASSGIGAGIARRLAADGAHVVINYASDRHGAQQVVADIEAAGGRAVAVQADVRQQAEVEQSRIRHLEQAIERLSERIQRLEDERSGLSSGPLDEELAELSEQLAEMELRSETEQQQLTDLSDSLQQERETLHALHQERDIRRGEI